LKCGAGKGWRSVGRIEQKMKNYYKQSRKGTSYKQQKKKAACIRHTLRKNCLLKHVMAGKIEGRIKVAGRQRRRRTQLPDDLRKREGTVN
jgi:hypothetical protein